VGRLELWNPAGGGKTVRLLATQLVVAGLLIGSASHGDLLDDSTDVSIIETTDYNQTENSVFIHPRCADTVLVSNNSSTFPFGGPGFQDFGADHFVSTDGGANWAGSVEGAGEDNRGDPATAIDLDGRFFVGYIASNGGQGVAYSDDGADFTHVQVVDPFEILDFDYQTDKNHLWADNHPESPYEGRLYSAWTLIVSGGNPPLIAVPVPHSADLETVSSELSLGGPEGAL
jgi:hypothetical protein